MSIRKLAVVATFFAAWAAQAQIQTAGNLLLNIDPSSLSGLSNGAKVTTWTNSGTLGGCFIPAVSGQGAVYQTSVGGAPAVTFAASANSVMTNTVPPPSSILSNNIWSAEIWVLNPTLESPEDQLSWTDRGNWTGSSDGTCMEIRYCSDSANAVEHYNSTCNIPWTSSIPQAGIWHHVAITRDTNGVERLYRMACCLPPRHRRSAICAAARRSPWAECGIAPRSTGRCFSAGRWHGRACIAAR